MMESLDKKVFKSAGERLYFEESVKKAVAQLIFEFDLPKKKGDIEYDIILKIFGELAR